MNKSDRGFVTAIIAMGAMTCLAAFSWAQTRPKAAGQDVPPWVQHDKSSNALSGLAVDLINAIAKDAGLQIQYQVIVFADLIPAVTSGRISNGLSGVFNSSSYCHPCCARGRLVAPDGS